MKKICVLGLGYIGFPTSLLFAREGFNVVGVDINKNIVESLNKGKIHIEEPGLAELFSFATKQFLASTEVQKSDIFLVAVPTPLKNSLRVSDLSYVKTACEMISSYLKKGNLVIVESTVTPGTCEKLCIPLLEKSGLTRGEFLFAYCPERAIPGNTLTEMIQNDRIIGGFNEESIKMAREIYSSFVKGRIYSTDIKTAEFTKLIENTYRDVNIAFANELAQIASDAGINVWEAINLANKHPRVNILNPGPGVGGHCIAVDPWFLTENSSKWGIIQLARDINDAMPNYVLQLVRSVIGEVKDPIITVFGIAYKANVDDVRETPALKFIKLAENEGFIVKCYDPHVRSHDFNLLDFKEATKDSDCIVLLTDHDDFRSINPSGIDMRHKNVIDTRNILTKEIWIRAGFRFRLLGDN